MSADRGWRALSRPRQVALVLAALCLLGALAVKPVLRRASPQLAVDAAYSNSGWMYMDSPLWGRDQRDPWGSPWHHVRRPSDGGASLWQYSVGPDRRDDTGGSTAIQPAMTGPAPALEPRPQGDDLFPRFGAINHTITPLARAPELLTGLALLIAWLALVPWVRRPRSPSLPRELLRALGLASLPLGLALLARDLLARHDQAWRWSARIVADWPLLLPASTAFGVAVGALVLLAALAWRLSRAREE